MSSGVKKPLFAAVLCAAAIAPLAAAAYAWGPVKALDMRILVHLRREVGPVHDLASVLVNLGDLTTLLVLGAVAVAIGLHFGRRREVIGALVVIAGANLTTQLLKVALEHAPPQGMGTRHRTALGELVPQWTHHGRGDDRGRAPPRRSCPAPVGRRPGRRTAGRGGRNLGRRPRLALPE